MGRATFAICVLLCASWVAAEQAVNPPPRPLHKIDSHWTPYDPPKEFPPDAQVYTIQKHDTLWALAKKNLGNPYLWPQIWEKNQYIKDAHWIYPGDPLVVGVKVIETPAPAPTPTPEPTPVPTPAPTAPPAVAGGEGAGAVAGGEGVGGEGAGGTLQAIGSEDDVYCFAYLDVKPVQPKLTVVSAENGAYQAGFATGDIVYISGGESEGVKAGQEFFVILPGRDLNHPVTGAVLGRVMRYIGHVRVLCAQDHFATAEVMSSCDAIPLGAWLKPFDPIPIPMAVLTAPLGRCDPASGKAKGYIVYSRDDIVTFGMDTVVMLDLGDSDQVQPGTLATIFRDNNVAGAPRIVLGELAVLTTGNHWATAKIFRSSGPMFVGDRVQVK